MPSADGMPPSTPAGTGGGAHVAPLQAALLDDPLDFLTAEHARQTVLLGHLERVARDPQARAARDLAAVLLRWLAEELPMHIADEEHSLYPRLAAFDVEGMVARLCEDHRRDQALVAAVAAGLRRVSEGRAPEPGFVEEALRFAANHRAHLALEEERLAPLARRRLMPEEVVALAAEMSARRRRH
jgi:hemerythrin-like domain-containing protein